MKEKRKRSSKRILPALLLALLGIFAAIIGVLVLLGPSIGNVFSNVVTGLDGEAGRVFMSTNTAPMTGLAAAPQTAADAYQEEAQQAMFFQNYGVNPETDASQDNLSTFALDVDTASYTLARSYLLDYQQMPEPDSVRSEEFINYFPVEYAPPQNNDAFAIHLHAAPAPFGDQGQVLLRVGLQGRVIAPEDRLPALLVFVIDTSGSMDQTNRLELAKQSLAILTRQLREDDRVAIVVYSDNTHVVLQPTPASEQQTILSAIESLHPTGSTYAEAGLRLGYEVALENMRPDTLTRVVLVSDGVANVGATGPDQILETVRQGVDQGVTLTTVGFGMGNFNDVLMEQLANDGNGSYFYVDSIREARRVFVHSLTGTLQVIGYDARVQVEFDPQIVTSYRLIGYENREIADEQFRDDTVDAGEIGAGHSVTALYELDLAPNATSGILATVHLRYEDADTRQVHEISHSIDAAEILPAFDAAPADFQLHAAVAEFSEILRESPYAAQGSLAAVLAALERITPTSEYTSEMLQMVEAAQRAAQQQ